MTTPHTLPHPEDTRQIEAVLLRYCSGIDQRDWALFRSCFTDDFAADYGPFGQWQGADAFTAVMQAMHADLGATLHRLSNVVLHTTPNGAQATSYVDAILASAPHQPPDAPKRRGIGTYTDQLVKTDAGWKLHRRTFTAVHLA